MRKPYVLISDEKKQKRNHYPRRKQGRLIIYLTCGKARITLRTHKIDGLHDNDFILAAKIDPLQP